MFPLRDVNPTMHRSIATFVIIVLNAAAWIFVQGLGSDPALARSVCQWGAIPGELLGTADPGTRIRLSQTTTCIIDQAANWFTPISSMFLHGGWLHIIMNMWFLAVFGDNVEDSMGRIRFVIFYLLCGLAAFGAQAAMNPDSVVPMVGASGAIGGVMGAYIVLYPRTPIDMLVFLGFWITRVRVPAFMMLGYWFLLQLLSAIPTFGQEDGGGVAFFAHIGGFLAGVALIFVFRRKARMDEHRHLIEEQFGQY
ncbi:MAG: rhomboid family intramembrane serine protease [Chitinivibrionales bacterium]